MQFQSSLLALASILPLALGAPVGVNTDNLTRSQKALLDSSKLIVRLLYSSSSFERLNR